MNIHNYWSAVLDQNAEAMRSFFHPDARINWHNTNESFTAEEFIRVNCDYPGSWAGEIEKTVTTDNQIITAVHVHTRDSRAHFHVTSFLTIQDGQIRSMDEYWGEDGSVPQWRRELGIGRPIK